MPYVAQPHDGVVWITGAGTGIGRALALGLALAGYTVVASARTASHLQDLADEAKRGGGAIHVLPLDVTDAPAVTEAVRSIVEQFGTLSLVIFNAGISIPMTAQDFNTQTVKTMMDVNVMAIVYGLEAVLPLMQKQGKGQIALVSSIAGYGGLPTAAGYCATKAAVIALAEALRMECEDFGVTVQVINPGFVATPLTAKNKFKMPFLMTTDQSTARIMAGLKTGQFEITFPKRFSYFLKFLNVLPYSLYFWLVKRGTR